MNEFLRMTLGRRCWLLTLEWAAFHIGLHMEFVIKYKFPFLMLMGSLSFTGITKKELGLQFASLLALQSRGIKCLLLTMALKLGF